MTRFKTILIIFILLTVTVTTQSPALAETAGDTQKKDDFTLTVVFDIPDNLKAESLKFEYKIGYGKGEIASLIKKEQLTFEKNPGKIKIGLVKIEDVDYSKFLSFAYAISFFSSEKSATLKGGGGNFVNLSSSPAPIKEIVLNVSYKEDGSLLFVPNYQ